MVQIAEAIGNREILSNAFPIYCFENLIRLSDEKMPISASRRVLITKYAKAECAISVCEPVELCRIQIESIHPLPFLINQRNQLKGLRGLAMTPEGLILLVDLNVALSDATIKL